MRRRYRWVSRWTDTGAADWVAKSFLALLDNIGAGSGLGSIAAISILTIGVSNTMTAGAAVAGSSVRSF